MNKKDILIEQVRQFDSKYFNEDQKSIMIEILKNAPEKQVQEYADFLFMKRRTGFAFDYSPEISKGRLITLREDKDKRINVNDEILDDENKLIIGDNYNALKSLLVTHKEKINVIYIDPPYNTESAKNDGNNDSYKEGSSSKFIYKDKFGRTGWLNMMKDRLTLAKDLLTNDGVIFVSIDDNEQAYLKVLMDEIFYEINFINCLPRSTRRGGGRYGKNYISDDLDYLLIYTKDISITDEFKGQIRTSDDFKYKDWRGKYTLKHPLDGGSGQPNYLLPLEFKNKIFKPRNGKNWSFSDKRVKWMFDNDMLVFKDNGMVYAKNYSSYKVVESKKEYSLIKKDSLKGLYKSDFLNDKEYSNDKGTNELKKLSLDFNYPKPISLIKKILNFFDNKNVSVLDFFAGSGTTGHAVIELNKEDGGNRKFILATNNENKIAHDVTYERLYRIINGKGTRGENFDWAKNNKPYNNVKLRVINIDDSVKISLDQEDVCEKIFDDCKNGLKLLDNKYNKDHLELYYDLAALNPLEKDCK